jgi:LuxR family maltose regulon positive regulatory protein
LERAVRLGLPGGYVRTFVDESEALRQVLCDLQTTLAEPALLAYIDRLCAAFALTADATAPPAKAAPAPVLAPGIEPLIEPLSERELEVLRYVATGLSDRQVAETLIVAIGTVKRHLNNIYGKLGVHSRTQALARARDLGLL